jgi:hypothetical protein
VNPVAYETKSILVGICDYIRLVNDGSKTVAMIYEHVRKMANADSANVEPLKNPE